MSYDYHLQTAVLTVLPPCQPLLMSLSLTQLLVRRLDVINLLEGETHVS